MIQWLLDGADYVMSHAPHCWLMTCTEGGGIGARPMGRISPAPSQTGWNLSFLADARSKKLRDIRSSGHVRLIFKDDDDAFVSVGGVAAVIFDPAVVERRWIPEYDRIFPSAADKANAVFIDIRAEELRLWIRGLTPEPFGVRSVTLHRPLNGDWHLDSERP